MQSPIALNTPDAARDLPEEIDAQPRGPARLSFRSGAKHGNVRTNRYGQVRIGNARSGGEDTGIDESAIQVELDPVTKERRVTASLFDSSIMKKFAASLGFTDNLGAHADKVREESVAQTAARHARDRKNRFSGRSNQSDYEPDARLSYENTDVHYDDQDDHYDDSDDLDSRDYRDDFSGRESLVPFDSQRDSEFDSDAYSESYPQSQRRDGSSSSIPHCRVGRSTVVGPSGGDESLQDFDATLTSILRSSPVTLSRGRRSEQNSDFVINDRHGNPRESQRPRQYVSQYEHGEHQVHPSNWDGNSDNIPDLFADFSEEYYQGEIERNAHDGAQVAALLQKHRQAQKKLSAKRNARRNSEYLSNNDDGDIEVVRGFAPEPYKTSFDIHYAPETQIMSGGPQSREGHEIEPSALRWWDADALLLVGNDEFTAVAGKVLPSQRQRQKVRSDRDSRVKDTSLITSATSEVHESEAEIPILRPRVRKTITRSAADMRGNNVYGGGSGVGSGVGSGGGTTKTCVGATCSATLRADAKFCGQCGAKQTKRFCTECGHVFGDTERFCPECGEAR